MRGGYSIFDFGEIPSIFIEGGVENSLHVPGAFSALSRSVNGKPVLAVYRTDATGEHVNVQGWCQNTEAITVDENRAILFTIAGIDPHLLVDGNDTITRIGS